MDDVLHLVATNQIVLFIEGPVSAPATAASRLAVSKLRATGINCRYIDVQSTQGLRTAVCRLSCWSTMPQLFLDGEFVGGSYIIGELIRSGEIARVAAHLPHDPGEQFEAAPLDGAEPAIWSLRQIDGQTLAGVAADGVLRVWNILATRPKVQVPVHNGWANGLSVFPERGQLVTCSTDCTIRQWRLPDARPLRTLSGHQRWVNAVAVARSRSVLLSGGADRTLRLWDFDSGTCIKVIPGHTSAVWSVAFSPDERYAVSTDTSGRVLVWRADTMTLMRDILGHTGTVTSVAFIDSDAFVTSGIDALIRVWDVCGRLLCVHAGHRERVWCVDAAPAAGVFVSASADCTAILWHRSEHDYTAIPVGDPATACALVGGTAAIGTRTGRVVWHQMHRPLRQSTGGGGSDHC